MFCTEATFAGRAHSSEDSQTHNTSGRQEKQNKKMDKGERAGVEHGKQERYMRDTEKSSAGRIRRIFTRAERAARKMFMNILKSAISFPVKIWQAVPRTPSCRFHPSCSHYFLEAIEKYGIAKGSLKSFFRLMRCHPFARGGVDMP